jgi:hypothetical protein
MNKSLLEKITKRVVNINRKNIYFTYQYYIACVATGNNCHTLKHAALDGRSAHTQYTETT